MPASPLIPKEQLSAYQRWELGSFDSPSQRPAAAANSERVQQIDARAREEGYASGHREGTAAGRIEGLEAARREALVESALRIERLDEMLGSLTTDLSRLDRELAHEVVQLGLAVARKLVGEALRVRPAIVTRAVEEALRHVAHIRGPVTLAVNPEDAEIVRGHIALAPPNDGWTVRDDPLVARGGCRVETAAGEVDATMQQRWHRISAALGQPVDWVE